MRTETLRIEQSLGLLDSIKALPWIAGFKVVRCSADGCGRWLTQRHLTSRRVGVKMQGNWYCSYSCFERAAADRLRQLMAIELGPLNHVSRMPLALILINRGLMTHDQLKDAVTEQNVTGAEIGEVLVALGYVTEKQLISARSMQWGCPVFTPSRQPAPEVHIPLALMRLHGMAPLHYVAATNSLLIGFVYGIEYGVLYAIEEVTGCKTRACLITLSDFETKMHEHEHSGALAPDDIVFDSLQTPSKMSHVLCNYGQLSNADEVVIGRCRDHLWVRLKNRRMTNDILFRAL